MHAAHSAFAAVYLQDVAVEVLAGPQTLEQLQGYGLMLFVGLLLTFLLKFVERQGHKLTIYPSELQ